MKALAEFLDTETCPKKQGLKTARAFLYGDIVTRMVSVIIQVPKKFIKSGLVLECPQSGTLVARDIKELAAALLEWEKPQNRYDLILEKWNAEAKKSNLPGVKILNDNRKKRLLKAFKEIGDDPETWAKVFEASATKGFIGGDGREFIPNWDYIFRNNNYIKLLEEYDLNAEIQSRKALNKFDSLAGRNV